MSNLTRKILMLESDIMAEKAFLQQQNTSFKKIISSPLYMTVGIISGFTLGFAIERFELNKRAKRVVAKTSAIMTSLFRGIRIVSSIISI